MAVVRIRARVRLCKRGLLETLDRRTDDIRALFGHIDQVATRPRRKFNSIYDALLKQKKIEMVASAEMNKTTPHERTYGANDICNMADARPARRTEVQHLRARPNEDLVHATQHTSSQLAPERIPHPVLDLRAVFATHVDRDADT